MSLIVRRLARALVTCVVLAGCSGRSAPTPAPSDPPAQPGAMAPRLAPLADGVLLTWLEPRDSGHRLIAARRHSSGAGDWSEPQAITTGDAFFANWADLPGAVQEPDGRIVVHWLERLGSAKYAYGVRIARSTSEGLGWTAGGLLHDDASATEHGFVSWLSTPSGTRAFWLDGRAMEAGGSMQLRTTLLDGAEPRPSMMLDESVCDCCATDAAMTFAGAIVVYRDRSANELRDIAYVIAGTDGYTDPALVHADGWQIGGCPVNGPAVAAEGGDQVAVAWFTAAQDEPRVLLALSADSAHSFATPIIVDADRPVGRVDVTLDGSDGAVVCWMAATRDGAEIRLQRIAAEGPRGVPRVLTTTTPARSAGVPTMVREGERLVIAWVEDVKPSRLRVATVAIDEL